MAIRRDRDKLSEQITVFLDTEVGATRVVSSAADTSSEDVHDDNDGDDVDKSNDNYDDDLFSLCFADLCRVDSY